MATIRIIGWSDSNAVAAGWGFYAPSRFRSELRHSVDLSLAERREIERSVRARTPITIDQVHSDSVGRLRVVLEALGAVLFAEDPVAVHGTPATTHLGRKGKRNWLRTNAGGFMQQYQRKAQRGVEPNDRSYDRKIEGEVKRMDPFELDELLNGDDEEA